MKKIYKDNLKEGTRYFLDETKISEGLLTELKDNVATFTDIVEKQSRYLINKDKNTVKFNLSNNIANPNNYYYAV